MRWFPGRVWRYNVLLMRKEAMLPILLAAPPYYSSSSKLGIGKLARVKIRLHKEEVDLYASSLPVLVQHAVTQMLM